MYHKNLTDCESHLFRYSEIYRAMQTLRKVQSGCDFDLLHAPGFIRRPDRCIQRGEIVKHKLNSIVWIQQGTRLVVQMHRPGRSSYAAGEFISVRYGRIQDPIFYSESGTSAIFRIMVKQLNLLEQ